MFLLTIWTKYVDEIYIRWIEFPFLFQIDKNWNNFLETSVAMSMMTFSDI